MKLRTQLFLVTAVVLVTVVAIVLAVVTSRWQRELERGARQRGRGLVVLLAQVCAEPAMAGNYSELQRIVDDMAREEHIVYASVLDREGRVVVSSRDEAGRPFFEMEAEPPDPGGILVRAQDDVMHAKTAIRGHEVMDFGAPLTVYRRSWGVARLGLDLAPIAQATSSVRRLMFTLGLGGLALGALLAALFAAGITRPLARLVTAAQELSKRHLDARVGVKGAKEVVTLGTAFNEMADRIKEHVEKTEEKSEEIEAGYRILARIASNEERESLIEGILEVIAEISGASHCSLMAFDARREQVDEFSSGRGGFTSRVIAPEELGIESFDSEQSFLELFEREMSPGEPDLFVPISGDEAALAALVLRPHDGKRFTTRTERLTRAVSRHLLVALDKARLYELAIRDGLTGLTIRRYFMARLQEEVERSERYDETFCVLMMDIDHFKRVNDTWGHPTGDHVLRSMAARVKGVFRATDLVSRYGGEELIALLLKQGIEGGMATGERVRAAVAERPFDLGNDETLPLTLSIGVAAFPEHGSDARSLVEAADEALYRAKEGGRNRVERAQVNDEAES